MSNPENRMKNTRRLAVSAILCAVGIAVLYLGSLTGVLDWTALTVGSIIVAFAVIEIGGVYPVLIWAVTSALAVILLPNKLCAAEYLIFAGIYPIFKSLLEKLNPVLSWILKIVYFNIVLTGGMWILKYVLVSGNQYSFGWLFYLVGNAACIAYDVLLTLLVSIYTVKLRGRMKIRGWK